MAIKLRALSGMAYLRCLLRRIELSKEMFILDIEGGHEVFIPKDLSQDKLPYSMRYYDPIIAIVQENVSEFSRDQFNLRNFVAYNVHTSEDFKRNLLAFIGIGSGAGKLDQQLKAINARKQVGFNHNESPHTMRLQRSKYLHVENNIAKNNIYDTVGTKK